MERFMQRPWRHHLEDGILLIFILLQVADFFEMIPGDLDFIKKIHSWVLIGYLFYRVALTKILFGNHNPHLDLIVIIAYFLFSVKNLTGVAIAGVEEAQFFRHFFEWIVANSPLVEKTAFVAGGYILIFTSAYMAWKVPLRRHSLVGVLHEAGPLPKTTKMAITRFLIIIGILLTFFITVFNLFNEWLAIGVDAPLVVVGILIYLFIIVRYHKRFHTDHFVHKIGNIGEDLYERFIELLSQKKRVYLFAMGLLALHLITDIGNFIIPYIATIKESLYFSQLGQGHTPFFQLFSQDMLLATTPERAMLILLYLANIIGLLFLLFLPSFIWYRGFSGRELHFPRWINALVLASLLIMIVAPAASIKRIGGEGLVGVDILTKSIRGSGPFPDSPPDDRHFQIMGLGAGFLALLATLLIGSLSKLGNTLLFKANVGAGLLFFAYYIGVFFIDVSLYYLRTMSLLVSWGQWFIVAFFLFFWTINILLYVGGYLLFLYEVKKRKLFMA